MKASELRIGNYIFSEGIDGECDALDIVDKIEENNIRTYYREGNIDNNFKPIPLTEEWLVKFGYYEIDSFINEYRLFSIDNGNFDGNFIVRFYREDIDVAPFSKYPVKSGDLFHSISLQYLHQLQNLYFALTGEEFAVCFWFGVIIRFVYFKNHIPIGNTKISNMFFILNLHPINEAIPATSIPHEIYSVIQMIVKNVIIIHFLS